MAYDYPGSCAPSRWLPSAPKQKLERGPFGLAHRVPRASPMRAASGCLPPAVRIIPQYVPGLQPRFGVCCQSRAIYYQQIRRGLHEYRATFCYNCRHMNKGLIYPDECYAIRGAIYEVHNEMGSGFKEEAYQQCLEREFDHRRNQSRI